MTANKVVLQHVDGTFETVEIAELNTMMQSILAKNEALQKEVNRLKKTLRKIPCQLCDIGDFRAECTCKEYGKK